MCGIIGIAISEEKDIREMLKKSLEWLTYRGYDSCGVGIKVRDKLKIIKNKGMVESLDWTEVEKSNIGIGHTRWATHGAPNKKNAHPHCDCKNEIAVVHNGIINNYMQIKERLKNHNFLSETDTEVIPHLIEENLKRYDAYKDALLLALRDTIKELEGTFAIAVLWNKDERIYAVRKTSPLVIGIGKNVHFISSDIPAFLQYTNRFIPLEDNQITMISADKFELYDDNLNIITPTEYTYPFKIEEICKNDYQYYMLKEINEQSSVLSEILNHHDDIKNIANKILKETSNFEEVKKVYFTGCGSSFHACIAGKYIFESLLGIPSEAIISSEFLNSIKNISLENTFIIVLTQSGETFDTYMTFMEILKTKYSHVLVITNLPYCSMERLIFRSGSKEKVSLLRLYARPEICVVATKTYTAELYLLALLTLYIAQEIFPDRKREFDNLLDEGKTIPAKVRQVLEACKQIETLAKKYTKYTSEEDIFTKGLKENFFVIGRGINLATTLEASLKLKEIGYVSAEGMPGGELKHGSFAVLDRHTPVIVVFPPSDTPIWRSTINNFIEIQARGAPIISICCESDSKKDVIKIFSKDICGILDTEWLFSPVLEIIPLQLLAYYIATTKKLDPDHPRNLAKTVTVE